MVLPTGALAYKVLNNANISSEKKQLITATVVSLTYENMTKQLKAIYDSSANSSANELVDIKSEPVYYANKHEFVNETPKDSRNFINSRNSRIFSNTRNRNRYAKQSNSTSENYDKFGQKTNPLDKSGRISRCVICKSIYHWANDCPNKVQDTSDDVNITLFSQEMHECYMTKFVGETLNCAVLDSGCTKNACGESWLTNYLDTLTESDRSKVVVEKSSNSFRFGNGKSLNSEKMVTFPAQIGKEDIMIKSDVIDSDLPLLLSKSAMSKCKN